MGVGRLVVLQSGVEDGCLGNQLRWIDGAFCGIGRVVIDVTGNGTGGDDMGDFTREEFHFALEACQSWQTRIPEGIEGDVLHRASEPGGRYGI